MARISELFRVKMDLCLFSVYYYYMWVETVDLKNYSKELLNNIVELFLLKKLLGKLIINKSYKSTQTYAMKKEFSINKYDVSI